MQFLMVKKILQQDLHMFSWSERGLEVRVQKRNKLDGCFLKSYCQGELLCAEVRDANNGIFPISWAVVCVENKDNWKWFIENLIEDLNCAHQ